MQQEASRPQLSVVVPVYNEADSLPLLKERLDQVLEAVLYRAEIIFVDDGSRDNSRCLMRKLVQGDRRCKAVILSRNYGHQVALTAGLDACRGEVVVVLDADLQDPPELMPEMLKRWEEGFHVVYGERRSREGETFLKKASASVFYQILSRLSGTEIPRNVGDFRLMDRKVVEALRAMPEHSRFIRGMVAWVGFRQTAVPFDRAPRAKGSTKYSWAKMVAFAMDAIFSFSIIPLRVATLAGFIATLVAAIEIVRTLYLRLVLQSTIPGFSATFIAILTLGGLNLIFLGIVGEYIGRIYIETKRRPLYIVHELVTQEKNVQSAE